MSTKMLELLERIDSGQTNFDQIDLSGQNLDGIEINGYNLMMRGANFEGASLRNAKISQLQISYSNFQRANLEGATFESCIMVSSDFYMANCRGSRFFGGYLDCSCFVFTDLSHSLFFGCDWSEVLLGFTDIRGCVLGDINNIQDCTIASIPQEKISSIEPFKIVDLDHLTIERTAEYQRILSRKGVELSSTPQMYCDFFKKVGLSDTFVNAYLELVSQIADDLQSVFISYSFSDQKFADKLFDALRSRGVKVWYAPKNMKSGKKIHEQIHSAIQSHDRMLLVLSQDSMNSSWVSTEIAKAYSREAEDGQRILFPVSLGQFDNLSNWELFDADHGLDLARYIRQYYIPDFSDWESKDSFQELVTKLIDDLALSEDDA